MIDDVSVNIQNNTVTQISPRGKTARHTPNVEIPANAIRSQVFLEKGELCWINKNQLGVDSLYQREHSKRIAERIAQIMELDRGRNHNRGIACRRKILGH